MAVLQYLLEQGIPLVADVAGKNNLMQAARAGNHDVTQYLLTHKDTLRLDINARDARGENALFYGARSRSVPVVETLLAHHVTISENEAGVNVLSQSMCDRNALIASAILRNPATQADAVNGKDVKGRTVLHHLVEKGDLDLLLTYGRHYHPLKDADLTGTTILMTACRHTENMDIISHLCDVIKVDVFTVDARGRSAIFYAVEACHLAAVDYILHRMTDSSIDKSAVSSTRSSTTEPKEGILVDLDSGIDGSVSSICESRAETVSSVCDMRTDAVNSTDTADTIPSDVDGLSVLMVAVVTGNQYVVETLLRVIGKDQVGRTDKWGRTAVHYAAMHGYTGIMDLVLATGGALDPPDNEGLTPLMLASSHGKGSSLGLLLRRGADPEFVDKTGRAPLHHCFLGTTPSLRCVRLLVRYGAQPNLRDGTGTSPLMLACGGCACTQVSLIRHLAESGGDPVLQDREGRDAFDHCPFDANYARGVLREHAGKKQ